ncbi:cytochrome P450 2K1-like [Rhinoraja longicauda]
MYNQMYNAFPFLGFLPGTHKKIFQNRTQMVQLILNFYEEHQKTLNENDVGSLIDAFLVKREEESNNLDSYFHDNNLVTSVTNLFAAGTDTSSSTLRWAILLMMKYPEIQRNVQEEINTVIGIEKAPRMVDRKGMPYTDAVIHEVQRFANILPMNIPHATTKDTHFREFFIPKGMQVIPLLSSVLHDKTQWETPNDFNPSHFLDAEGKFVKRDAFMPFSAGSDSVEYLICEVGEISESIALLKQKLRDAQMSLENMENTRMTLEKEIAIKENSIFIDSEKCLKHRERYPTVVRLAGYQ